MELQKKEQNRSKNDSFRTNRHQAIPTALQPGAQPVPPTIGVGVANTKRQKHRSNSGRKRSRTMSFIRNLTRPPQTKASRFLDVAAAAEVKSPTASAIPAMPETTLPSSTRHQALVPSAPGEEGLGFIGPHEVRERFANVARVQQQSGIAGRYADLDAPVVREDTPPPFKRPRRSTADWIRNALGLTDQ